MDVTDGGTVGSPKEQAAVLRQHRYSRAMRDHLSRSAVPPALLVVD